MIRNKVIIWGLIGIVGIGGILAIAILLFKSQAPTPLSGTPQPVLPLHQILETLPADKRATLKGEEIAKIDSIPRTKRAKFEIEVFGLRPIKGGGVEFYARAWDLEGNPISLGTGVETEHFRIFNPPILVDDPNGDIVREHINPDTKEIQYRRLREDPKEALLQSLEHAILVTQKGKNPPEGSIGDTTSTFYPDAHPESTSGDAVTREETPENQSWATIIAAAGDTADSEGAWNPYTFIGFIDGSSSNTWQQNYRFIFGFDTSSIPDTDTIDSATVSLYGSDKFDEAPAQAPDINIYSSSPANITNIVASDYANVGNTAFSTAITYAGWSTSAYNDFALNANGLANISKTGVSKFSAKNANYDAAASAPGYGSSGRTSRLMGYYAEETGTTNDPKLVVVHEAAAAPIKKQSEIFF